MAPVNENVAIYQAAARIVDVLQDNLDTYASALEFSGIELPTPDAEHYEVGMSRELVDRMLGTNAHTWLFLVQQRPSSPDLTSTKFGSPSVATRLQTAYFEVSLFYRLALANAVTLYGTQASPASIMETRGWLYAGAIVECIRRKAVGSAGIVDIEKESDFAGAFRYNDDGVPVVGVATVVVAVRQKLNIPLCEG